MLAGGWDVREVRQTTQPVEQHNGTYVPTRCVSLSPKTWKHVVTGSTKPSVEGKRGITFSTVMSVIQIVRLQVIIYTAISFHRDRSGYLIYGGTGRATCGTDRMRDL